MAREKQKLPTEAWGFFEDIPTSIHKEYFERKRNIVDLQKQQHMPLPDIEVPAYIPGLWGKAKDYKSPGPDPDAQFVRDLLPDHYTITVKGPKEIYCESKIGISDATDQWLPIFQAIKRHFKHRFQEVNHTTCSNHLRFSIYLK